MSKSVRNSFPEAARHFDDLPDSASVDITVIRAITGKHRATIYRWIDKGLLPRPLKRDGAQNAFNVGEVRRSKAIAA